MKVTYNWLKELVAFTAPVEEVSNSLTSVGLEVASVTHYTIPSGIIVAQVEKVEKHPNADHLFLCKVAISNNEYVPIVCGAPNVTLGMKTALATVGTVVSPDLTIRKATIRSQESMGMLCSERELGISDNHDGIISLPQGYEVGVPINHYLEDDAVIEIELTPNRGDCLSVLGVARELSAFYQLPLQSCAQRPDEDGENINDYISVTIEDSQRCPRYMGRLIKGVTIKDSPLWMKRRLFLLDVRPICNIVDITNYIMLLFGQPMHSFDYAKIGEKKIVVKRAQLGQKFITLDDQERSLIDEDLLIYDGTKPTAIAGVMGGAGSGIRDDTQDVFLECAYFDPVGVRKTSKRLDLSSESSYRFERGVDPEHGCRDALDTAAQLVKQLGQGYVVKGVIDEYPKPIQKKQITLRPSRVTRLLGISLSAKQIKNMLTALQIELISEEKDRLIFTAPQFRHDLEQEVDLIEEVGRFYGYDNIPTNTHASISLLQEKNQEEIIQNTIRSNLSAFGLRETFTGSMTSEKNCTLLTPNFVPVKLYNPLNPDMSRMRTTLLGSLLEVTAYNCNRKNYNNGFFELGKVFKMKDNSSETEEKNVIAILIEGNFFPSAWNNENKPVDFYMLKGIVDSLQRCLHLPEFRYLPSENDDNSYLSSESSLLKGPGLQGCLGKIKSSIGENFDLKTTVYFAEIDITDLLTRTMDIPHYSLLPRFPAIERDFCFVMDEGLFASTITKEISLLSNLIEYVKPFDIYKGEKLGTGLKSIAFTVHLRDKNKTLTDNEAKEVSDKIVAMMKTKFNADLR